MGKHRYYNTTDSPVTVDDEGRSLGGSEHGTYEPNDVLQNAVDQRWLLDKGPVDEGSEESDSSGDATAPVVGTVQKTKSKSTGTKQER